MVLVCHEVVVESQNSDLSSTDEPPPPRKKSKSESKESSTSTKKPKTEPHQSSRRVGDSSDDDEILLAPRDPGPSKQKPLSTNNTSAPRKKAKDPVARRSKDVRNNKGTSEQKRKRDSGQQPEFKSREIISDSGEGNVELRPLATIATDLFLQMNWQSSTSNKVLKRLQTTMDNRATRNDHRQTYRNRSTASTKSKLPNRRRDERCCRTKVTTMVRRLRSLSRDSAHCRM